MKKLYVVMFVTLCASSGITTLQALAVFNSTPAVMTVVLNGIDLSHRPQRITESKIIPSQATYVFTYLYADSSTSTPEYTLTISYTDTTGIVHSKTLNAPQDLNPKKIPSDGASGRSGFRWAYIISLDAQQNPQILNYTFKQPTQQLSN